MIDFEKLKKLADSFFEWPTEDRTHVTTTSAILFAQHALAVAPRPEAGQQDGAVTDYGSIGQQSEFIQLFNAAFEALKHGHSIGICWDLMKCAKAELNKLAKQQPAPRPGPTNEQFNEVLFAQHALAVAPRPEAGQPTYETEIERVIARMDSSDPDFDDCADAVALIHRLAAEIKGPDGYATWRDAAIAERVRRVNAEWVGQNGLTRPAEPKCWCHSCRPVTLDDMRMVLCPDCGNKRCPKANDHRHACTSSNEPGQPGSAYPAEPAGGAV